LLVLAVLTAAGVAVKYGRYQIFPKRFAVVEPGQLYRSGHLEPWPLERVIREHGIRTILALTRPEPDTRKQQQEAAVVAREGLELIRIGMPGDGCAPFDSLDQAADVIADTAHRPLLVHCAAGVHRTGASYAAWRIRYCGWTLEQVFDEARRHHVTPDSSPKLCAHIRRYYASRAATTRPTPSPQ